MGGHHRRAGASALVRTGSVGSPERPDLIRRGVAMDPVQASELDSLEIYHATPAAKIVVEKLKSKTAKRPSTVPGA